MRHTMHSGECSSSADYWQVNVGETIAGPMMIVVRDLIVFIIKLPKRPGQLVLPTSRCSMIVGLCTTAPAGYRDVPPPLETNVVAASGCR